MALKKNIGSDNTYLISQDDTENPKLRAKVLADGRESLYLEYYFGYTKVYDEATGREIVMKDRRRKYLSLYLWQAPRTTPERRHNKETLELAKKIRYERGQQMLESAEGYRLKKSRDVNFLDWFWAYYEAYNKGDKRSMKRAYTVFVEFLNDTEEYRKYAHRIKPDQLTKGMMIDFTEYLQHRFRGEGGHTVFARFKKAIKNAEEKEIISKNPCVGVTIKIDGEQLKKDVLSIDEVQQLISTHYDGENPNIRRAFIFCLYCGLRWCDVKDLTFANVDYSNHLLKFEQNKTKGHSAASGVIIPLNEGLLQLIGQVSHPDDKGALIFPLPSHTMALKALRHWVKRAGIDKHITWHCARHSFAVNILNNGANIKTVASLLGHSGLQHTEKYTRAVDTLKQAAIDSLPSLQVEGGNF